MNRFLPVIVLYMMLMSVLTFSIFGASVPVQLIYNVWDTQELTNLIKTHPEYKQLTQTFVGLRLVQAQEKSKQYTNSPQFIVFFEVLSGVLACAPYTPEYARYVRIAQGIWAVTLGDIIYNVYRSQKEADDAQKLQVLFDELERANLVL